MTSAKLMLVRHSITEGNLMRRYVGITDESLCQTGLEKAQQCALEISFHPEKIYCSPLKRCLQTADILFPTTEKIIIEQLRECSFGIFEGKTHAELERNPDYIKWVSSEGGFTPPGGESAADARQRCSAALTFVLNDMHLSDISSAAVITHGGVIMRIMSQLFGGGIYKWQPENCGGFLLEFGASTSYQKLDFGSGYITDSIADIL